MKLVRSFSIYAGSTLFNKAIGFLLIPVFTYYLSPTDYGTLSLLTTMVAICSPFILLQVKGAISVEFFRSKDPDEFKNFFVSGASNSLLSLLVISFIFAFGYQYLADYFGIESFWVLLVPLLAIVGLLPSLSQTIFQVKNRPISYGLFSMSRTMVELGLSLMFVISLGLNYAGRMWGILLSGILFTIIALVLLHQEGLLAGKVVRKFQLQALYFGGPLIPHAVGALVINASDRIFIAKMVSVEELGLYSIGYAVGSLIMILEQAFTQAWTPFLFQKLSEDTPKSKREIVKASYAFMLSLVVAAVLLSLLTPFIFTFILSKEFYGGSIYVFWIALGYVFSGFYKMFAGYIFYLKKTKILAVVSVMNVVVNVALNYFLINQYGAIGAAYATTISFFIFFATIAHISNRLYPMPWLTSIK